MTVEPRTEKPFSERTLAILAAIQHVEKRLDELTEQQELKDAIDTVEVIRQQIEQMRRDEADEKKMRDTWREAVYRAVTTFASWIKPKSRSPK